MAAERLRYFHPRHGVVVVKRGFSWPAFLFGSLWAVARRLWVPVVVLMVPVDLLIWFITGYAEGQKNAALALAGFLLVVAYAVVRGWYGNRWVAAVLVRRGYTLRGTEGTAPREFTEPTF